MHAEQNATQKGNCVCNKSYVSVLTKLLCASFFSGRLLWREGSKNLESPARVRRHLGVFGVDSVLAHLRQTGLPLYRSQPKTCTRPYNDRPVWTQVCVLLGESPVVRKQSSNLKNTTRLCMLWSNLKSALLFNI